MLINMMSSHHETMVGFAVIAVSRRAALQAGPVVPDLKPGA